MKYCKTGPFNPKSIITRINERVRSLSYRMDRLEENVGDHYNVKYIPQNLSEGQKKIARSNLDIDLEFENNEILKTYLNNRD